MSLVLYQAELRAPRNTMHQKLSVIDIKVTKGWFFFSKFCAKCVSMAGKCCTRLALEIDEI
jgi:hypothetical protein